jgi:sterol 3beta-glucosyltransferase
MDIQERLDIDSLRCDLSPGRLASWLHRKTGAHLSGFAVGCLRDHGLIEMSDIKLLRHKHWYVDEGAESPAIGAIAAVSGFAAAIGTATSDYTERLRNSPHSRATRRRSSIGLPIVPTAENSTVDGHSRSQKGPRDVSQADMEALAQKMASKTLYGAEPAFSTARLCRPITEARRGRKNSWKARESGRNGHVFYITRVTGKYACDLAAATARAPVAFFYNVANGFHNAPSNVFDVDVRRRDEITGLGSGVRTAGKEFCYGIWDAFSGIVVKPYEDTKVMGVKGLGRGLLRGGLGIIGNLGSACFGLPGYTLKGLEKELLKGYMTRLKAEILLIRLRQGIDDWRKATESEKDEVVRRWKVIISL